MTLFLVLTTERNDELDSFLREKLAEDDVRRLASNQWFVSSKLTTQKLYDELDPGEGGKWGDLIIAAAGNHYGYHELDTWDWVDSKRAASD